ncbi:hypothetical protein C6370_04790 [Bacillus atrophaeus]|uniref:SDR family NAD(P)-dependent oxidoreductase n=1 Tax=Bacillus atrophaeus TaxID=1452 RepID=UPI000D05B482|nr:SDR family NAD(P)-dependent oxidoreductase [Bacillus atrophaeus]PSA96654.1 hypothetical protein C6370_04790 [Bacillus atrophaeus]
MDKHKNKQLPLFPGVSFEEFFQQFHDKELFTFCNAQGESKHLTGKMLEQKVKLLVGKLDTHLKPQEKVILILPQGLEYICSILACFHSNVTAIPTSIVSIMNGTELTSKIKPILSDSNAKCIITNTVFKKLLEDDSEFSNKLLINVDISEELISNNLEPRKRHSEDIAIILYTSGSTAQPKGVMLTHKNVMHQAMTGAEQWEITQESRIVSWMPQFHNFGLFFNIMAPLLKGSSSVILPSDNFVKTPHMWLEMIDHYQATHTAAPNFAFEYCCSAIKVEEVSYLSLSSLETIVCGGEPIQKENYEDFFGKFQMLGLKSNIFCPHYGMSEMGSVTTLRSGHPIRYLALDIPSLEKGKIEQSKHSRKTKSVVSCGEISKDVQIVCVNQETNQPCSPNEVGEIWVKSPSLADGYFNQIEETKNAFGGTLEKSGESGFFRTGDLGFIRENHLYIIGREKEVIIINGKNHHPVDIEWTIKKSLPSLTLPVCVFSTEIEQREKVIVVQEVVIPMNEDEYRRISHEILGCVSETHGIEVYQVMLVQKGVIPKAGSGKIQRKSSRSLYQNGKLSSLYQYPSSEKSRQEVLSQKDHQNFRNDILTILKNEIFTAVLHIDSKELDGVISFSNLGLDSIKYVQVSKRIEEVFQIEFSPAMLFKHRDIEQLANYLLTQIKEQETSLIQQMETEKEALPVSMEGEDMDIAVIGISCNFPGEATNPDLFWKNIIEGRDCISTISESRPQVINDYMRLYSNTNEFAPKWGGFISNIEQFDASFFGISPIEAESMDPQQRKLLELTWNVIEDGGYDPVGLTGNDIGLFIGAHSNDYAELIAKRPSLKNIYGAYLDSGLHNSMITNRVSRWFNFHGPSEIVNTACSSSLVSIHHAIEAINRRECTMAIAGGINLILSSRIYTASHQAGMLSKDGRCKSFDEQADGFVRSEGYGAVLLKPYGEAVKDNDTIYGVIKGSAVNHDGHSNSLRAPNLNAQKQLYRSAYGKSGIPVDTISYLETHGTGTALGDPIEFQALQEAFQEMSEETLNSYCGLGTVKTFIGHSESAAGIAGLIKVLLSMKEQTLPGILHFKKLNPYISLEESPFYINDKACKWERLKGSDGQEIPRRAGISSFGFGGANAHIIVEEYVPVKHAQYASGNAQKKIIPISAKNKEQLLVNARQLLDYLESTTDKRMTLSNLVYTLQVGRTDMEERVVFLVNDVEELKEKIRSFLEGKDHVGHFRHGNTKNSKNIVSQLGNDEDLQELISRWFNKHKFDQIAQYWTEGGKIDWNLFYDKKNKPSRINLPTYTFADTRYWISDLDTKTDFSFKEGTSGNIHLLLQKNTSDLTEQRFSTTFTGKEFFLSDHTVKGERILPGVIHLEMARASLENSFRNIGESGLGVSIKDVVWSQPVSVQKRAEEIHIGLFPEENGQIAYEVYSGNIDAHAEQVLHSQGYMTVGPMEGSKLDLTKIRSKCKTARLNSKTLYDRFSSMGINYGPSHMGVEEIHLGEGMALAKLKLPSTVGETLNQFVLHPSMLDAALQASSALVGGDDQSLTLPYMVKELNIVAGCSSSMWAKIEHCNSGSDEGKVETFNIELCDDQGNVCVRIKEVLFVAARKEFEFNKVTETNKTLLFSPEWKEQPYSEKVEVPVFHEHLLILVEPDQDVRNKTSNIDGIRQIVLQSHEVKLEERYYIYALKLFEEIQAVLKEHSKSNVFIQLITSTAEQQKVHLGLAGLLRTASLENPRIICQVIGIDNWNVISGDILHKDSRNPEDMFIHYREGKRYIFNWENLQAASREPSGLWKDNGVYLITGGLGGLGFLFAKEIVHKVENPTLILTGRSEIGSEKKKQLDELEKDGATVTYNRMDVSQKGAVHTLIDGIIERFGKLNGILHSAGIIRDNYLIKKTEVEWKEVLAAKVQGLVNLDQASETIPLDFFILFSSISGILGNPGQADYATANAFMDHYADYRNELFALHKRSGHTISVNWPLWEEGGMQLDPNIESMMEEKMGMEPLKTSHGMEALYHAFKFGKSQVMVIGGKEKQIRAFLNRKVVGILPSTKSTKTVSVSAQEVSQELLQDKAVIYFKNLLSSVMKLPAHEIDPEQMMDKYGIDSIMIMQLTERLEKVFSTLPKTLFFEYQTIRSLTGYFLEEYPDSMMEILGLEEKVDEVHVEDKPTLNNIEEKQVTLLKKRIRKKSRVTSNMSEGSKDNASTNADIAIIGLAGRYPGANNLHEFWKNISSGKDCITEVPLERWDHSQFFDENKNAVGKTYTKWGGFIEDVDRFDPLFFNISPREAEMMDPQERLFLECVHETIEDAGYSRDMLRNYNSGDQDGNVGVFIGAMFEEYQLYGAQLQVQGNPVATSGTIASIANRVSYTYNLHGPCMAVDTMCSSSLTALHLACQSLHNLECGMAIAGGVNLSIHPNKYLLLAQGKFASSKGRCQTFGKDGDGYVPGEGVGAVLLKPLSKAIEDGDHIYGVIKATAINHGGKTNGYTVPNPNAQANVIGHTLRRSGVDPRTINYLEAHGTGTSLGDPIEIAGLTKAFRKYTQDEMFCAIGSVKSNIGHCEGAAGIAGLTKILLQLKHGKLAPSLHSEVLNPNIDFNSTPFFVQQELEDWKRVVIQKDGSKKEYPRRAGISAFGAGGSNAHVVIEEYKVENIKKNAVAIGSSNPALIVLSAKSEEQLLELANRFLNSIKEQTLTNSSLSSISYTLQVGREAYEERLAMTVTSLEELQDKLHAYLEKRGEAKNIYIGSVKRDKVLRSVLFSDEDIQTAIESWISKRKYGKLLDLWVTGFDVDWEKLYTRSQPQRISLPTYPFAKERYWLPELESEVKEKHIEIQKVNGYLHPLLHKNTSNLIQQRFSSTFTGNEFFLKDHVVMGKKILPGSAYLEMIREAIDESVPKEEERTIKLKNILWSRPFGVNGQSKELHIGVYPEKNGEVGFEIYSEESNRGEEAIIHCQGQAGLIATGEVERPEFIDIRQVQAECTDKVISGSECYEKFRSLGIIYGNGHKGIESIYIGEEKLLAKITLPKSVGEDAYILHPSVVDSAIQATIAFSTDKRTKEDTESKDLSLPFALEELEIITPCTENMWAVVRKNASMKSDDHMKKLDIDLIDENGKISVRMKALSFRNFESNSKGKENIGAIMFRPVWKQSNEIEV